MMMFENSIEVQEAFCVSELHDSAKTIQQKDLIKRKVPNVLFHENHVNTALDSESIHLNFQFHMK